MQRRAAAAYAGLFILIAVGAYVMVGVAQEPAVSIENPDHSLAAGDTLEIGDRTYTVDEISDNADASGRNATLSWTNASERQTATLANNSELPAINVTWPGQTGRTESTLANGSTVQYEGGPYTILVEDGSFTLVAQNVSFSVGDTFPYRGNRTNVTAAGDGNVTLAWNDDQTATLADGANVSYNGSAYTLRVGSGAFDLTSDRTVSFDVGDPVAYRDNRTTVVAAANGSTTLAWGDAYNVTTQTASNDSFDFRESFNVSAILRKDPAVRNEPESINGTSYVVYRNNSIQPLTEYLPEPEVKTFTEGDSLGYVSPGSSFTYVEVTVENVTADRVLLDWRGPVPYEVTAEHGGNVTLGPDEQLFVAEFPDNDTLELTSDVEGYQDQIDVRNSFHDRVNGLWGISILSGLAAVFLIGAAYLPSRY